MVVDEIIRFLDYIFNSKFVQDTMLGAAIGALIVMAIFAVVIVTILVILIKNFIKEHRK